MTSRTKLADAPTQQGWILDQRLNRIVVIRVFVSTWIEQGERW
ncbi:hypothetical protein [Methylobacterium sp. Leaf106]|nr:hypothetical protein [Methylobacterium sp. Leaf106]